MMLKTSIVIALFALVACQPEAQSETKVVRDSEPVQRIQAGEHTYTGWAGKWTGPEGTYLSITPQGERKYRVEIANLDGPRVFRGQDREHGIQFTRDGSTYVIHASNGDDTGMKWLAGKTDCLKVQPGEGYCRD